MTTDSYDLPNPNDIPSGNRARPLPPEFVRSELILHSVFLAMAAMVLLMSVLMRSEGATSVYLPGLGSPMPQTCSSQRIFGIDCPGCGLTRSFISISQGDFSRAWQLNRASFVVYLFVAIQIPWQSIQIWKLWRTKRAFDWRLIYMTPVFVAVILMVNWIWKMYQSL